MAMKFSKIETVFIFIVVLVLLAASILALLLGYIINKTSGEPKENLTNEALQSPEYLREIENKTHLKYGNQPLAYEPPEFRIMPDFKKENSKTTIAKQIKTSKAPPTCPSMTYPSYCIVPHKYQPQFNLSPKRKPTNKVVQRHKYLVSLSEPLYIDDKENYKFICTGVAIGKYKILTGQCIDHGNYRHVIVRSESDQWFHGGKTHRINSFISYEEEDKLTVLSIDTMVKHFIQPNADEWETGYLIGWDKDPLLPMKENVPVINRIDKRRGKLMGLVSNKNVYANDTNSCDDRNIGKPLVYNYKLLGMVSGANCDRFSKHKPHVFQFIDLKDFHF